MGADFVEPPEFDLKTSYLDSNCCVPLTFILASASDPIAELQRYADDQGFNKNRFLSMSLGQGQGPIATKTIDEGVKNGSWVLLQNCHMARAWMPTLELIYENIAPDATHPDFRLWLTTEPCDFFPKSILQNCVKMIWEQPKSLRSHLIRSYVNPPICKADWFNSRPQSNNFKRLLYSLCFFHAIVRERVAFGAIGWSNPYDFTELDLTISINNLELLLSENENDVNFKAYYYLTANCIYGGRISDQWDQRILDVLLMRISKPELLDDSGQTQFGECDVYYCPQEEEHDEFLKLTRSLPLNAVPSAFGLHNNTNMYRNQMETDYILDNILALEVKYKTNTFPILIVLILFFYLLCILLVLGSGGNINNNFYSIPITIIN